MAVNEMKRLHSEFITELCDHIHSDSLKKFKLKINHLLKPKARSTKHDIYDILDELERIGFIAPGNYEQLKEVLRDIDVRIVPEVEEKMKLIISKMSEDSDGGASPSKKLKCDSKARTSQERDSTHEPRVTFNISQMVPSEKCVIAGISNLFKKSDLEFTTAIRRNENVITVQILALSDVNKFGEYEKDIKLSILITDGKICLRGLAFGNAAHKVQKTLRVGKKYSISRFGVKYSNQTFTKTKFELRFYSTTNFQEMREIQISPPTIQELTVATLKKSAVEKMYANTCPFVITAIGEIEKKRSRFLREVYIKDFSGKMKLKFWYLNKNDFEHGMVGDVIKLKFVYVDVFNEEMFLQYTELSSVERIDSLKDKMKTLLEDEDSNELECRRFSIADVKGLTRSRHHIQVKNAKLMKFAKEESVFYFKCIVRGHGALMERRDGKKYCDRCKKRYTTGEKVVSLKARFDDGSQCLWATLYTTSVKRVLLDKYRLFNHRSLLAAERYNILREIEEEGRIYNLCLSARPFHLDDERDHNITVQDLREVENQDFNMLSL